MQKAPKMKINPKPQKLKPDQPQTNFQNPEDDMPNDDMDNLQVILDQQP